MNMDNGSIWNMLYLQDHLKTTYEDCKNDSGKGLFQRMKNKMEGGVDNERPNMFQSASSTLLAQLEQLMVSAALSKGEGSI